MVEFALVFPMLMVLLLGIIEVGRLLAIYVSVSASSREAARYASAAGISENGMPYYLDIAGIEAAARRVTLLTGIKDVFVQYDTGPGSTDYTPASADDVALGNRVVITVVADYTPFFGLVPALKPFEIVSTTSRTILKRVEIAAAGGAGGGGGGGGGIGSPDVIINSPADGDRFAPGDTVIATGTATASDGTTDLSNLIEWYLDGAPAGTGPSYNFGALSSGYHEIAAQVTDPATGRSDSDAISITVEEPQPVVIITSPADGAAYCLRYFPIAATGIATASDGSTDISSQIQWRFDGGASGSGQYSTSVAAPSMGLHKFQADVTDPASGLSAVTAQAVINVIDNPSPTLTVLSPNQDAQYLEGASLTLEGEAKGASTNCLVADDISYAIQWKFDGQPVAGSPARTITVPNLTAGDHTITASITDPATGKSAPDETRVIHVVTNSALVVNFNQPVTNNHVYTVMMNTGINFSAEAMIGTTNVSARSQWTWTDLSTGVVLGNGQGLSSLHNIELGVTWGMTSTMHTIKAQAWDQAQTGQEGYATITVVVTNSPPVVTDITITPQNVPEGITDLTKGMELLCSATGYDTNPAINNSQAPTWTWYDGDNQFGTGASVAVTTTEWAVGAHTIKAELTDAGGLSGSQEETLTLKQPTCPTGGALDDNSWSCNGKKCEKLNWNFNATIYDPLTQDATIFLESLQITWVVYSGNPKYEIASVSFGAPTPTTFPLPVNTTTSPVEFVDLPLWYGAFNQINVTTYGRTLTITFGSNRYPSMGDDVGFTLYAKFQYCPQTQQSNVVRPPQ